MNELIKRLSLKYASGTGKKTENRRVSEGSSPDPGRTKDSSKSSWKNDKPWMITGEEYHRTQIGRPYFDALGRQTYVTQSSNDQGHSITWHRHMVIHALHEGKKVPQRVIDDHMKDSTFANLYWQWQNIDDWISTRKDSCHFQGRRYRAVISLLPPPNRGYEFEILSSDGKCVSSGFVNGKSNDSLKRLMKLTQQKAGDALSAYERGHFWSVRWHCEVEKDHGDSHEERRYLK